MVSQAAKMTCVALLVMFSPYTTVRALRLADKAEEQDTALERSKPDEIADNEDTALERSKPDEIADNEEFPWETWYEPGEGPGETELGKQDTGNDTRRLVLFKVDADRFRQSDAYNRTRKPVLIEGAPCLCKPSLFKEAVCMQIRSTWELYEGVHQPITTTPDAFYRDNHCPEIDKLYKPVANAYEKYNKKAGWKKVGPWWSAKLKNKAKWMKTDPADWKPFKLWGYHLPSSKYKAGPVIIIIPGLPVKKENFLEPELVIASMLRIMGFSVLVLAGVDGNISPTQGAYVARINGIVGSVGFVTKGRLDGVRRQTTKVGLLSMAWGAPRAATVFGEHMAMPGLWLDSPIYNYANWFKHKHANMGAKTLPQSMYEEAAEEFVTCVTNHYTGDLGENGIQDGLRGKGGFGRFVQLVGNPDDPHVPYLEAQSNKELLTKHEFDTRMFDYKLPKKVLANPNCQKHQVAPIAFPEQYRYHLCTFWHDAFRFSQDAVNCGRKVDAGIVVEKMTGIGKAGIMAYNHV